MDRAIRVALVALALLTCAVAAVPRTSSELGMVAAIAYAVREGRGLPGWRDGPIPYSWGGGHAREPGPSRGTCVGYHGSIRPCPARKTVGLDCSGLARWVYHLAFGRDVLGSGNTDDHLRKLRPVPPEAVRPGDLVYYGTITPKRVRTHHVGVYVGNGKMVNALRTGTTVRVDDVTAVKDFAGYFRLNAAF
ncbi:cell wall-associated NlpC family hydrolase [Thermocatellispora tengchongensis]|uniref:Cell wall-associated NlpC family hydrolase n=1 Tax=Thermocatellispora tengchongensis TaxID=1073253 RepID=A0A840PKM0_9ACTN|nr:NlpC/P60 family protein [Thermocatellispora tengchongensis]MBB5140068.1 cell wall-associated NlpC family hydrolase [Thermocatellispora tengchongensis]